MKNLFSKLMVLSVLFTPFLSNAQEEAGFYPPDGSSFNADSTVVTLPEASTDANYNETISFYATSEITIPDLMINGAEVALGFVSAEIVSVDSPDGMTSICDPENMILAKGGVLCDIIINDEGVNLTFKNFMHQHFQIKMQECLLFQKLSNEEKVLLSAIEYLNKNNK